MKKILLTFLLTILSPSVLIAGYYQEWTLFIRQLEGINPIIQEAKQVTGEGRQDERYNCIQKSLNIIKEGVQQFRDNITRHNFRPKELCLNMQGLSSSSATIIETQERKYLAAIRKELRLLVNALQGLTTTATTANGEVRRFKSEELKHSLLKIHDSIDRLLNEPQYAPRIFQIDR